MTTLRRIVFVAWLLLRGARVEASSTRFGAKSGGRK